MTDRTIPVEARIWLPGDWKRSEDGIFRREPVPLRIRGFLSEMLVENASSFAPATIGVGRKITIRLESAGWRMNRFGRPVTP